MTREEAEQYVLETNSRIVETDTGSLLAIHDDGVSGDCRSCDLCNECVVAEYGSNTIPDNIKTLCEIHCGSLDYHFKRID